jgi:hypothetical protein
LGFPKLGVPKQGLYLKHYIDEPDWIYIWVLGNNNIPMGYKLIYTREIHNSLLGVQGKSEQGKFMILGEEEEEVEGEFTGEVGQNSNGGFTVGGDIGFYEWDFEARMPPKNITIETETNR